jgi:hypothetical protein
MHRSTIILGFVCVISLMFNVYMYGVTNGKTILGQGSTQVTQVASTTVISVTTTSKQLLATSSKRTGFSIQNTNCSAAGVLFVAALKDAPATVTNGYAVMSSTTDSFNDSWNPASNDAVQGIVNVGTCSVVVTEWRNAF